MRREGRFVPRRARVGATLGAAACGLLAVTGSAAGAVRETVSASKASFRACDRAASGAAVDAVRVKAPVTGVVRARLKGGGDWDLGVLRAGGRTLAGSAGFGTNEVASGYVRKGERLRVQACRMRGDATSARLTVEFVRLKAGKQTGKTQIVDVSTPTRADKKKLQSLGLDLTEHADRDSVEVVLHGDTDAKALRAAGFRYQVRVADLAATARKQRRADARYARTHDGSPLPSGQESYRHLWDYEREMKRLAMRYPGLVKPLVLNHRTLEGRQVHGIEVTKRPWAVDGKPVYLQMGIHHAREWPSSEHVIEFAYDLLKNYGRSRETTRLVNETRTIFIPVVNPDGFNASRESPGAPIPEHNPNNDPFWEYKRKNCRVEDGRLPLPGECTSVPRWKGVDLNRNYGGFWGGPGASADPDDETYRGAAPFSEPETQNVRELVSTRHVVTLITNHTYSNLVLRPPGIAALGPTPDEPEYKALGDLMASRNGYTSDFSYGLYDTTGTTEDWTYYSTGGFGFTFEIGPNHFHPPYEQGVVDEYLGTGGAAGAGKGGNRAAYYDALRHTANASHHAVLTGKAPKGVTLRLRKDFLTETSPVEDIRGNEGPVQRFSDRLDTVMKVSGFGRFEWHINQSTRPLVESGRPGRNPAGPPQGPITLVNGPGQPQACGDPAPVTPGCYEETTFEVQGPPAVDNGRMILRVEWPTHDPQDDWDIYLFDPDGTFVGASAQGGTDWEQIKMVDPKPGTWTLRVANWDATSPTAQQWTGNVRFESPRPAVPPGTESWILSCEVRGRVIAQRAVTIDRGQRLDVGRVCGHAKGAMVRRPR